VTPDEFDRQAELLLPCPTYKDVIICLDVDTGEYTHARMCPAWRRPAVAAALREGKTWKGRINLVQQGDILAALLKRIGEPYDDDHKCLSFLASAFELCGITITEEMLRDAKDFVKVDRPEFADIAVFQELPFSEYHAAFMLSNRWAIQSSAATNGVGRIEVMRSPWIESLRGFYRHKSLCS